MADTISVLVASADPGKGIFGNGPVVPIEISVERLKASLSDLVAKLRAATSSLAAKADGLRSRSWKSASSLPRRAA
jgi:hypothetical protein